MYVRVISRGVVFQGKRRIPLLLVQGAYVIVLHANKGLLVTNQLHLTLAVTLAASEMV